MFVNLVLFKDSVTVMRFLQGSVAKPLLKFQLRLLFLFLLIFRLRLLFRLRLPYKLQFGSDLFTIPVDLQLKPEPSYHFADPAPTEEKVSVSVQP